MIGCVLSVSVFGKLMGKVVDGMLVVVLQFVKVKIFQGMVVFVCLLLLYGNLS